MLLALGLALSACDPGVGTGLEDDTVLPCDVSSGASALSLTHGEALQIDWGDASVWAVAVTSPGARIGAMGKLESGILYWQVASTEFGQPLTGPLTYGRVPEHGTDYTSFAGGVFAPLEPGSCYELQISDPSHQEFGRLQFRPPT